MVEAGGLQGNGLDLLTLKELRGWKGGTNSKWKPIPVKGDTGLLKYLGLLGLPTGLGSRPKRTVIQTIIDEMVRLEFPG